MKRFINLTSLFSQVTLKLFYLLILLLTSEALSQTFTVKGNITTTDSTPVKYASVTFIDESDTTKKYFTITDTSGNYQLSVITNIKDEAPTLPQSFELMQNYPNPFSDETNIPYKLNEVSNASVTIYNILGQEVKSFKALEQAGGMHGVTWDGRDDFGKKVSTGVYFYQLLARGETQVKKMIFTVGGGTNAKLTGGVFSYQGLKKERLEQTASGIYTVQISNTDNTRPKILFSETSKVILQQDTTLNFKIEKGIMAYSLVYEKVDSSLVNGSYRYNWELYLNNITGTKPKNMTNWRYDDYSPRWSPDGRYIAIRRDQPSGAANLYIYDTDNDTCMGVLVSDMLDAGLPGWTPDSKKIYYQYHKIPDFPESHIINVNGSNDRKLEHPPAFFCKDNYTFLYFDDSAKVYKTNIDNSFNEFILDLKLYGTTLLQDFNPNTEEILFSTNINKLSEVKTYNIVTKNFKTIYSFDTTYQVTRVKWDKGFSKVVALETSNGAHDSTYGDYLSVIENGIKRRLVHILRHGTAGGASYFSWYGPKFSPDGEYIAYVKLFMQGGAWVTLYNDLYVVNVNTGEIQKIDSCGAYDWNPKKTH